MPRIFYEKRQFFTSWMKCPLCHPQKSEYQQHIPKVKFLRTFLEIVSDHKIIFRTSRIVVQNFSNYAHGACLRPWRDGWSWQTYVGFGVVKNTWKNAFLTSSWKIGRPDLAEVIAKISEDVLSYSQIPCSFW